MHIPQSEKLTTRCLGRVFDDTVATYKYYWFLSILDLFVQKGETHINIWDIIIRMVSKAWYPVNYFRLSFGKSESLYQTILNLQQECQIPINLSETELIEEFENLIQEQSIFSQLKFLQNNVPYRFLRPWIDTADNHEMVIRSQNFENGCLYKLEKERGTLWITLNPVWHTYLKDNYPILRDFTYWNLTQFLQVRNPNVPNISNKIIKSETRNSLTTQRSFWNCVIRSGTPVHCIYTGLELQINAYDLDHFIPWSFVSHNLLWNLMPANPSINSSKSDKLPDLSYYLPKLANAHQAALRSYLQLNRKAKILEDYLSLGHTAEELVKMDQEHLYDTFYQTFSPLHQIALNMGFESWKTNN